MDYKRRISVVCLFFLQKQVRGVGFCLLMLSAACSTWAVTYYVDDDAAPGGDGLGWSSAFDNVQDAVDAASLAQGGDVWVAEGIYTSYGANVVQLLSDVSVYGGFSGDEQQLSDRQLGTTPSIIDGESDRRCVNAKNVTGVVIDGFVLTNGLTTEDGGAGMHLSSSSAEIRNCHFLNNKVNGFHELCYGGGVYNWYSSPTIINCIFENNSVQHYGGGGMLNIGSSPTITNCLFKGNTAPAHGAGLYNVENSSPTITNCIWTSNTTIGYGGGVFNHDRSSPTIINCSFNGNSADLGGEGVYNKSDSSPVIRNCIVWGVNAGIVDDESTSMVTYSCVRGGFAGEGNIDLDPMFADDELHLMSTSPCIDAGTGIGAPETDILGLPRPYGPQVDMGAYEFSDMMLVTVESLLDLVVASAVMDVNSDGFLDAADLIIN